MPLLPPLSNTFHSASASHVYLFAVLMRFASWNCFFFLLCFRSFHHSFFLLFSASFKSSFSVVQIISFLFLFKFISRCCSALLGWFFFISLILCSYFAKWERVSALAFNRFKSVEFRRFNFTAHAHTHSLWYKLCHSSEENRCANTESDEWLTLRDEAKRRRRTSQSTQITTYHLVLYSVHSVFFSSRFKQNMNQNILLSFTLISQPVPQCIWFCYFPLSAFRSLSFWWILFLMSKM